MMQIDFYPAGKDVLLIFTGRGGNTKGDQNKYVRIAENINRKYYVSVFVAAVPENCWENPKGLFCEAIERVFAKISPEKFFVMGYSAGGNLALWYSYLFSKIDKVWQSTPF